MTMDLHDLSPGGADAALEAAVSVADLPGGGPSPEAGAGPEESASAAACAQPLGPRAAPAVSAAQEAAAFVARIFAEAAAPEPTAAVATPLAQEAADAAPVLPPVAAGWPGEGAKPLQDQHILILGLGASGLAMARWGVRCGARVTVADTRAAPPQLAALQHELPQVRFVAGAFGAHLVEGQALAAVYRSPGLSPGAVAPVLVAARAEGVRAGGELDLYSMALQALRAAHGYAPAVLAITGTNGKTTVTALTAQLVAHAGRTVAVAGNIGPTLLDTLAAHIDAGTLPEVWVLELSSFQLDARSGFEPTAAAVLNLTQDHLDWHGDMAAYAAAKARIFGAGGAHGAQPRRRAGDGHAAGPRARETAKAAAARACHLWRRHAAAPRRLRHRDRGRHALAGARAGSRRNAQARTRRRRRGAAHPAPDARRCAAHPRAPQRHSMRWRRWRWRRRPVARWRPCSTACANTAASRTGSSPWRIVGGVEYFDDSKGTNVGATVAALTGLGADRRLVVILGGEGKGQDFAPLAAPVARYARAVVLIGRDAPLHRARRSKARASPLLGAADLAQAVQLASARAHAGDAVLLSPACASFDMFRDYEHRAQVFCAAVQALADDAGQPLEGLS